MPDQRKACEGGPAASGVTDLRPPPQGPTILELTAGATLRCHAKRGPCGASSQGAPKTRPQVPRTVPHLIGRIRRER